MSIKEHDGHRLPAEVDINVTQCPRTAITHVVWLHGLRQTVHWQLVRASMRLDGPFITCSAATLTPSSTILVCTIESSHEARAPVPAYLCQMWRKIQVCFFRAYLITCSLQPRPAIVNKGK